MTTAEIQAFLAIAKYRNITRAAEILFISQSSLSTRLKTLERELNCTLFIRSKGQKEIALTDAGEKFLPLAMDYEDLVNKMMQLSSSPEKEILRVASINSLGTYLFPPIYEGFLDNHPEIELQIQDMETPGAYKSLKKRKTDIAFTGDTEDDKAVSVTPIFSEPIVFICSEHSDYPETVDFSMLNTEDEIYINWTDEFEQWHTNAFRNCAPPQIRLSIMPQLHYFVTNKDLWAFVPLSAAKWLEEMGGIHQRNLSFEIPPRIVSCLYLSDRAKDPQIQLFIEYLRLCLKKDDSHTVTLL